MYLYELATETWPMMLVMAAVAGLVVCLAIPPRRDAAGLAERFIERAKWHMRTHPDERGNFDQ